MKEKFTSCIMDRKTVGLILTILLSLVGNSAFAYSFKAENSDGVVIYYNLINDETELEVTGQDATTYSGSVVIPEDVSYKNSILKVTRIGNGAFSSTSVSSVTIPNSVTSIGAKAFISCYNLASIIIPNSVTSIGECAFYSSGIKSVTISENLKEIEVGVFYKCEFTSVIIPNSVTSIGSHAFQGCYNLVTITIPNNVTSIGSQAFQDCRNLVAITIPNKITSLESDTFRDCWSLTSVTIPNDVKSIGACCFDNCKKLNSVTIPNSVTSIGDYAFKGCGLQEVISYIENPFDIWISTFSDDTYETATLYVPVGTINKYKTKKGWMRFMNRKDTLPSSIADIESVGAKEVKRYSLDGRVLVNPHKGINIIQMDNGTYKKVLLK